MKVQVLLGLLMNHTAYTKQIPPFFQSLLGQINKINLFSFQEQDFPFPNEVIHYQPYKAGINIYTSVIIKLSHELAHLLEIKDNRRLTQFDFGIKNYFPKTATGQLQAVAREARARGIQTRLVQLGFGNETLLIHRAADLLVRSFPIARFNSKKELLEWSAAITQATYNDWSKERIVEEWKRKAEFINHWLETSEPDQLDYEAHLNRYKENAEWSSSSR